MQEVSLIPHYLHHSKGCVEEHIFWIETHSIAKTRIAPMLPKETGQASDSPFCCCDTLAWHSQIKQTHSPTFELGKTTLPPPTYQCLLFIFVNFFSHSSMTRVAPEGGVETKDGKYGRNNVAAPTGRNHFQIKGHDFLRRKRDRVRLRKPDWSPGDLP